MQLGGVRYSNKSRKHAATAQFGGIPNLQRFRACSLRLNPIHTEEDDVGHAAVFLAITINVQKTMAKTKKRRAKRSLTTLHYQYWIGKPPSNVFVVPIYQATFIPSSWHPRGRLIRQEDANIIPQGTNELGALETWQGGIGPGVPEQMTLVGCVGMCCDVEFWHMLSMLSHAHILAPILMAGPEWDAHFWGRKGGNVEVLPSWYHWCPEKSENTLKSPLCWKHHFGTVMYEKWSVQTRILNLNDKDRPWNAVLGNILTLIRDTVR